MLEIGSVVELENKKKYIITASSVENSKTYYLAIEVDYETEDLKDETMFFEENEEGLIPITNESDIIYLKTIFIDKFFESIENDN